MNNGQVIFSDVAPFANHPVQALKRAVILTENHKPGGIPVQAIYGRRNEGSLSSRKIFALFRKIARHLIGKGILFFSLVPMDQKPEGFFYNKDVIVFISDFKLFFCLAEGFLFLEGQGLLFCNIKVQFVTQGKKCFLRSPLSVDLNILADHFINMAQRSIFEIFFQEPVQPLIFFIAAYYYLYHLPPAAFIGQSFPYPPTLLIS